MRRFQIQTISNTLIFFLRLAWISISLTTILLTVVSIITLNQIFRIPCELQEQVEYCLAQQEALYSLGLSYSFYANWFTVGVIIEFLPWFIVGSMIFWRRSHTWFGYLFSLCIMLLGVSVIDANLISWTDFYYPATRGVIDFISFIGVSLSTIWFFFPDEKLPNRGLWGVISLWLIRNLGLWVFPNTFLDVDTWPTWASLGFTYLFALSLAGILIYRYRGAEGIQRQQIKWVIFGVVIFLILYIAQELIFLNLAAEANILGTIYASFSITPLYYLSSGLLATSILIAILRYRLFDIDILIRRTLQYSLLTGLLALSYFSLIIFFQNIFSTISNQQSEISIVLSTLAIAALFNPIRNRVQDFIDHRFYRKKYNAAQALAHFATTARDEVDIDKLTAAIMDVIQTSMQPENLSIWLKEHHPTKTKK